MRDVADLLKEENPYLKARAVWLLSQLDDRGQRRVNRLLRDQDERIRTVAYRALRHSGDDLVKLSEKMAKDKSPMVRREVALAMRNLSAEDAGEILATIAEEYDGEDRWYLEAIGTGAAKKETEVYDLIARKMAGNDPLEWSPEFADMAWRLHPERLVSAFTIRAMAGTLAVEARKAAIVALAYIGTRDAAFGILDTAEKSGGPVQAEAMWWLINRKDGLWRDYGLNQVLKERGLYDPEKVEITEIRVPEPGESRLTVEEIMKLNGDAARGKLLVTACYMCHSVSGEGTEFGPDLTNFAKSQATDVVIRSIIHPSADISHGFNGYEVELKDGKVVHGLVLSDRNPTIVASQGGIIQMIPRNKVAKKSDLKRSLMLSAEQLGFGAQEVADVVAYLKSLD